MKKLLLLMLAFILLFVSCKGGEETADSSLVESDELQSSETTESSKDAESGFDVGFGLDADAIKYVHITTLPESIDLKCHSYDAIQRMVYYLNGLETEDDFEENPDEYTGMSYVIIFKCKDGTTREIIHFGNMFVKEVGGDWKRMNYDDASRIEDIVKTLDADPNELDGEEIIASARLAAAEKYPVINEGDFKASLSTIHDGRVKVELDLYIFGYDTYESYHVMHDERGEILEIKSINEAEYSRYLPYVTEESVRDAEEALDKSLAEYDRSSGYYISFDSDGYLCLCAEVIVDIEPPSSDEDGELVGGCGIDHEHIFFSERISSKAFAE